MRAACASVPSVSHACMPASLSVCRQMPVAPTPARGVGRNHACRPDSVCLGFWTRCSGWFSDPVIVQAGPAGLGRAFLAIPGFRSNSIQICRTLPRAAGFASSMRTRAPKGARRVQTNWEPHAKLPGAWKVAKSCLKVAGAVSPESGHPRLAPPQGRRRCPNRLAPARERERATLPRAGKCLNLAPGS